MDNKFVQLKGHLIREARTRRSVTSDMRRHRKTHTLTYNRLHQQARNDLFFVSATGIFCWCDAANSISSSLKESISYKWSRQFQHEKPAKVCIPRLPCPPCTMILFGPRCYINRLFTNLLSVSVNASQLQQLP